MEPKDATSAEAIPTPEIATIARHLGSMLLLMVAIVALGVIFLKEPLALASDWIVGRMGLGGIMLAIGIGDALSVPVPIDALLLAAASSGRPSLLEVFALCMTSVFAGWAAYCLGPRLARIGWVGRRIETWRPTGDALFRRWGGWAVAVAALSPIPYSVVCWLAGIYKTPRLPFALATLLRIPRIGLVYAMCAYGFWAF